MFVWLRQIGCRSIKPRGSHIEQMHQIFNIIHRQGVELKSDVL
jgi:hypothetical protein